MLLLTNNPFKLSTLERQRGRGGAPGQRGQRQGAPRPAKAYLQTKAARMGHQLTDKSNGGGGSSGDSDGDSNAVTTTAAEVATRVNPGNSERSGDSAQWLVARTRALMAAHQQRTSTTTTTTNTNTTTTTDVEDDENHDNLLRPFVTLTYAQSLDGSIASGVGGSGGARSRNFRKPRQWRRRRKRDVDGIIIISIIIAVHVRVLVYAVTAATAERGTGVGADARAAGMPTTRSWESGRCSPTIPGSQCASPRRGRRK